MRIVQVLSPEGNGIVVSEVVLEGDPPEAWIATEDGPLLSDDGYSSLDEAMGRNNRATTTANRIEVASPDEAKAMLGKPPPER